MSLFTQSLRPSWRSHARTGLSTISVTGPGPTLSVHAYSPPLTAMSYYEVSERNTLRRKRTELTDQPEGK